MGKNTNISWTDHTWNPWIGCQPISDGCKNCYARRDMERFGKDFYSITRTSAKTFNAPLHWKEPAKVFVCSWSDFFHPGVPNRWLDDAWDVIRHTSHLTYQILTKRPQFIHESLPKDWGAGWPNVWLGVTVESDKYTWRMEELADIPAALHFVSYEPALGPLSPHFIPTYPTLKWVIGGGESAAAPRFPKIEWFQDAYLQCRTAGIPFFMKQDSGNRPGLQGQIPNELWSIKEIPTEEKA